MESPLLNKSESESSVPNEEHIIDNVGDDDYSSSTSEETPHEVETLQACNPCTGDLMWDLFLFVVTLVQIFAAIFILILTKDEQKPEEHLYPWIIGYICGSFATLPILCWRFWQHSPWVGSDQTGINEMVDFLDKMIKYFFFFLVMIFLWSVLAEPSCIDDPTPHFWLWMALLSFSCIRYVLPNLTCAASFISYPVNFFIDKIMDFIKLVYRIIIAAIGCIFAIFVLIFGCITGCIAVCISVCIS